MPHRRGQRSFAVDGGAGTLVTGPLVTFPGVSTLAEHHRFRLVLCRYGLILFQSNRAFNATQLNFSSKTLHDRIQVFVDQREVGSAYRSACPATVPVPAGHVMALLIENMGRGNYGAGLVDRKGLLTKAP